MKINNLLRKMDQCERSIKIIQNDPATRPYLDLKVAHLPPKVANKQPQ